MKNSFINRLFIGFLTLLALSCSPQAPNQTQNQIPHLQKQGNTTQLIVDEQPFLILGGELGNSSFTSMEYMEPIWPKLKTMNLNTVLAPVCWNLIEPEEGVFDFAVIDHLIIEARWQDLKLVLLWFGSWKNSMSCYTPSWVKKDQERFPRAKDDQGKSLEILTPFSENNLNADMKAFTVLMQHIQEMDGNEHTVIMIQPENEIGMLPTARDYCSLANQKFKENVPGEFIEYLKNNKDNLVPEFKEKWAKNGYKESGIWVEIFGQGPQTDEIFMAWYYAKYTNTIAGAGKAAYPLPMFVNAALNRPGWLPGQYPSAGPLPHLMDVWKAGAPAIDFLSPDIYFPDIAHWADLYIRQGNPLFIPETGSWAGAARALFILGHYEALGFSPFSIESTANPENEPLGKAYHLLKQLAPIIAANQGQHKIEGMLFDKQNQQTVFQLGNYEFTAKHSNTLGYEPDSRNDFWTTTGAIIIQTGEDEFYLAGSGIVLTFRNLNNPNMHVGILKAEEGRFANNTWQVIRHLSGDQTHQGRHIRILLGDGYSIQKFALYNYE